MKPNRNLITTETQLRPVLLHRANSHEISKGYADVELRVRRAYREQLWIDDNQEQKREKMRITTLFAMMGLLAVTTLLAGCSISYSTGKSSDSISTSLDSISGSSGSGGDTAAAPAASVYAEDVAAATVLYTSSQKSSEQFLQTISNIARSHGIVDWEQETGTYAAMGKGLKRAGVDEQQITELPYFRTLVGSADFTCVLQGYHQS